VFKNLNTSVLGIAGHQSEAIEQALTYGFRAMDLDVVDLAGRAKLRGMAFARRLIDSSKIRMSAFALPFGLEAEADAMKENLSCLADWASTAAEVNCRRCITTIEPAGDRAPYHENFSFHRDRLAEVCGVLAPHNIRLGIGFRAAADLRARKAFQFIHDIEALVMLAKMVNSPGAGIVLDTWDLFVSGGTLETVRAIPAEQIVAVQLADAPADVPLDELTERSRLLPEAEGRFDHPAVLVALAEMGYDGPVSVKPHHDAIPSSRSEPMAKAIGRSLDAVWKAAGLNPQSKLAPSPAKA
jgi:sugar phosphate isomerase/epimerase